jgi:hypothetical protein
MLQLRILTEEPGKDEMGAAPEDQFDDVFLRRIEGSMLSQVALQVRLLCMLAVPTLAWRHALVWLFAC